MFHFCLSLIYLLFEKSWVKTIAFKLLLDFASGHIIAFSNYVCSRNYLVVFFFLFLKVILVCGSNFCPLKTDRILLSLH